MADLINVFKCLTDLYHSDTAFAHKASEGLTSASLTLRDAAYFLALHGPLLIGMAFLLVYSSKCSPN